LELYQKCPTDNGSDEYEIERGFDEGSVGGNYITEQSKTIIMQSTTQLTLTVNVMKIVSMVAIINQGGKLD